MAKKTEKKTDKKIAKKTSSTKPKQKRQTTKHSVYVLIDKHEGVGEQYYEYLISKSDFEEVKDTIGILVPVEYRKLLSKLEQISPDYPYYEEGLKEGSLNIYEVPDEDAEIDPFRPPLFSTVASPSDWSEKDFELTPNDDQVVVEIVRTMGRYEVNTYFSGSPTSIDLESEIRDYDDDNYEESMTYEMCEKLNVRHSPVRGLTTDIESECLTPGMNLFCSDQCSDLEREYDAYYDTIEVYVRDSTTRALIEAGKPVPTLKILLERMTPARLSVFGSSVRCGNRTNLTSNTKPKQKIRKPKSDVVLDAALFFSDAGTDSDGDDASTKTRSKIMAKKPEKKTDKKIAKKSSNTKPKQKIGESKSKAEVEDVVMIPESEMKELEKIVFKIAYHDAGDEGEDMLCEYGYVIKDGKVWETPFANFRNPPTRDEFFEADPDCVLDLIEYDYERYAEAVTVAKEGAEDSTPLVMDIAKKILLKRPHETRRYAVDNEPGVEIVVFEDGEEIASYDDDWRNWV